MAFIYSKTGQFDKQLVEAREALRLDPTDGANYGNLVDSYLDLGCLNEALAVAREAQARKMDTPDLHLVLYLVAFTENDAAGMARQTEWAMGKPGTEGAMLYFESDTAGYSGELVKANELTQRAIFSAMQAGEKETAAGYGAEAALREALFGISAKAERGARAALHLSSGRDVEGAVGMAVAISGYRVKAQMLASALATDYPKDTLVQLNYLPTIYAAIDLDEDDPTKAIAELQSALPYEFGSPAEFVDLVLYPAYIRGEAYLAAHQGQQAAAEFQKIIDHPGAVQNEPIGALAHLGLARAYALEAKTAQGAEAQNETTKACAAYTEFFALWQHADPDIPILREAKSEFVKIK